MAAHERDYLVIAHLQRRQDDLARRVIDENARVAAVPQDIAPQPVFRMILELYSRLIVGWRSAP
jgi:hypothetical protein